jgi:putative DNA primase/helicase
MKKMTHQERRKLEEEELRRRTGWGGAANVVDLDAWRQQLVQKPAGMGLVALPNLANAITILRNHRTWCGRVRFNAFSRRPEIDGQPWTEEHTTHYRNWLQRNENEFRIDVKVRDVDAAVIYAAKLDTYNPVTDWLDRIMAKWDGRDRLSFLSDRYLGGDATPYARAVGRCLLVGAVARVRRPGCKLDTCPVLEGEQGRGKSTALAILGGPWFADTKFRIGDKDAYQQLLGVLLYEWSEMAGLGSGMVEATKAFLSSSADRFRPPFERHVVDVQRQGIIVGTTNSEHYLHDSTGNRRFPPLRTGLINLEALRADRDMLWAEAAHAFAKGERWWLEGELAVAAGAEADERRLADPWEEQIRAFLEYPSSAADGVKPDQLFKLLGIDTAHRDEKVAKRVYAIVSKLRWKLKQVRRGDERVRLYFPAK